MPLERPCCSVCQLPPVADIVAPWPLTGIVSISLHMQCSKGPNDVQRAPPSVVAWAALPSERPLVGTSR
jgi:hypothetical protein